MKSNFIILLLIIGFLAGCKSEEKAFHPDKTTTEPVPAEPVEVVGCAGCHGEMSLAPAHNFGCTTCHKGNNDSGDKSIAHTGIIQQPAHPDYMQVTCGRCHEQQVADAQRDLHFTLAKEVNQTRQQFGSGESLSSLTEIPRGQPIDSKEALADDMLRRRCLRCHVYSSGDSYPYVERGTGCASCHLKFKEGKLQKHVFARPDDGQCLSCHYGNYVGSDYYGKFENDYNWEYRTPYVTRQEYMRPYGVERYNLSPDIHRQKGLLCIDCHSASGHNNIKSLSCSSCHQAAGKDTLSANLQLHRSEGALYLTGKGDGKTHVVPQLTHPAHERYTAKVACQVCHAQWSFNDSTSHLLLTSYDEYDMWERLTVQGSSEVETLLEHNLYSDEDELPPAMKDGITGLPAPGIWLKGFTQRRWENILIRPDSDGIIKVFRPILDLRLSMITEDGDVPFDNVRGIDNGLRPYTPHTTGPAGLFYTDRFSRLLDDEPTTVTQ